MLLNGGVSASEKRPAPRAHNAACQRQWAKAWLTPSDGEAGGNGGMRHGIAGRVARARAQCEQREREKSARPQMHVIMMVGGVERSERRRNSQ